MIALSPDGARALEGPDWLRVRRIAAAERFASTGLPSVDDEHWRYSRIDELDLDHYSAGEGLSSAVGGVPERFGSTSATVTLAHGRLVGIEGGAPGLTIGRLVDHPEAESLLGSVLGEGIDPTTTLNDAFAADPVVIDVEAGRVVEHPVLVAHVGTDERAAGFPRSIVRLGADAECTVIELAHRSAGLSVPVVELDVGDAARLRHLTIQDAGPGAWHLATQVARVGAAATLRSAHVGLGGHYARQRTDCRLEGRGASGDLLAVYFGADDQMLDYRTFQDHRAPDTTSNLLFKGAVAGSASSVYTGLIKVDKQAVRTRAHQTNRNIKLSENAWAYSVPNLEIETNDVQCSHASAVGEIDADQRFYLESRGVPRRQAERLIVRGFFHDVVRQLPVVAAMPYVEAEVLRRLDEVTP